MYNAVIVDRLGIIIQSINMIESRMESISSPSDFNKDENGIMIMDSIKKRISN